MILRVIHADEDGGHSVSLLIHRHGLPRRVLPASAFAVRELASVAGRQISGLSVPASLLVLPAALLLALLAALLLALLAALPLTSLAALLTLLAALQLAAPPPTLLVALLLPLLAALLFALLATLLRKVPPARLLEVLPTLLRKELLPA